MASTGELPSLLWAIIKNFFERDTIMYITGVNYDDTLDLRLWHGEDYVDYENVHVLRDPFSKENVLNVKIDDRVVVSFIDGDKNNPIVIGVIQESY